LAVAPVVTPTEALQSPAPFRAESLPFIDLGAAERDTIPAAPAQQVVTAADDLCASDAVSECVDDAASAPPSARAPTAALDGHNAAVFVLSAKTNEGLENNFKLKVSFFLSVV
jgi:hypothetical protein